MQKRERTAGAGLIVAMSLFTFGRFKRRGHRLLKHFYPDNASRNPLARVLVAALLVISQLTSTLAPVYSQTSRPILSGSIAGQGTLSSGTFFVDYRLANTGVASFLANGFGLYDVIGNVAEWVNDWYDRGYYAVSPEANPTGLPKRHVSRHSRLQLGGFDRNR